MSTSGMMRFIIITILGVPDTDWIQTIENRAFLVGLRIYGSAVEFFDQTWKPDDIVKLK